ncbi:MAG TPA: hypothetical protein VHC97_05055 [Thermoanaerobaculia bacterium]|nr:hypothetical protein [Thermoanaerobaculia bacterium]
MNDGIIDPGAARTSLFDRDRGIEAWLLDTAGDPVSGVVREHVRSALARPAEEAIRARAEHLIFRLPAPVCTSKADDAPKFEPLLWNADDAVRLSNNCYNYANNQRLHNFSQPGLAAGIKAGLSCIEMRLAAEADSLVSQADFARDLGPGEGWYVALAYWPGDQDSPPDFHWYRQDKNGCWSHKPGLDSATNLDSSRQVIKDPLTCDRTPYTEFCTFMVTNNGVIIG